MGMHFMTKTDVHDVITRVRQQEVREQKEPIRSQLNADIEAFLARGGAIKTCQTGAETHKEFGRGVLVEFLAKANR